MANNPQFKVSQLAKDLNIKNKDIMDMLAGAGVKAKKRPPFSVILLTEYHANSIRLRRVLLLRSDIRLTPSDICCAS